MFMLRATAIVPCELEAISKAASSSEKLRPLRHAEHVLHVVGERHFHPGKARPHFRKRNSESG
jgi:hypothetical protein